MKRCPELRTFYLDQLISKLPPGSAKVEKLRETLSGIEGLCDSIARDDNPANREAMARALESAFFGAAEIESGLQRVTDLVASFVRERVALAEIKKQLESPSDTPRTATRTATLTRSTPALEEAQALSDLRAQFLEKIMEVQRPGPCQQRDDTYRFLVSLDRTCDSILHADVPRQREALLRATQAAFQSIIELDPASQSFVGLLTSYVQERVALEIENGPPFSADAPRIAIRSLIIPGDKTKEGMLINGVSTLWFEILRRIKADPDSIHEIDCWKWEEIVAGAYKQEGWEIVVLTPKRGDKGRDVIAQRQDWGLLRFLLLDQVKSYSPHHLVGPDEIREMAGVLHRERGATKGIITTTSDFTPGAVEEAEYLFPCLELKPRGKLLPWLATVVSERLTDSGVEHRSAQGE